MFYSTDSHEAIMTQHVSRFLFIVNETRYDAVDVHMLTFRAALDPDVTHLENHTILRRHLSQHLADFFDFVEK